MGAIIIFDQLYKDALHDFKNHSEREYLKTENLRSYELKL